MPLNRQLAAPLPEDKLTVCAQLSDLAGGKEKQLMEVCSLVNAAAPH